MANLHINGNVGTKDLKYHFGLSLVEFKEENVNIVYSPALDLSGYGINEIEAKNSFTIALDEFFKYTTNKKTIDKVLLSLGWSKKGSKTKPKYNPPKDSDLISTNSLYNDIVNTKSYKVSREEVEFSI